MTDLEHQPDWPPRESDYKAVIGCLLEMVGLRADRIEAFRIRDARLRDIRIVKQSNGDIVVTDGGDIEKTTTPKMARRRKV